LLKKGKTFRTKRAKIAKGDKKKEDVRERYFRRSRGAGTRGGQCIPQAQEPGKKEKEARPPSAQGADKEFPSSQGLQNALSSTGVWKGRRSKNAGEIRAGFQRVFYYCGATSIKHKIFGHRKKEKNPKAHHTNLVWKKRKAYRFRSVYIVGTKIAEKKKRKGGGALRSQEKESKFTPRIRADESENFGFRQIKAEGCTGNR